MKRFLAFIALLVCCGVAAPVSQSRAAGLIIVDEAHWWPEPIPPPPIPPHPPRPFPMPRHYIFAPLEVYSTKATVRVTDQIAVTRVEQAFYNPNPQGLEGTFVFPVPKGAHLDKFTMEIDGRQVEAELLPADKARGIYEEIVRKLRDPALLEYSDRDMFKVRIFPIEPHSKKSVTLTYTQLLKADDGLVGYTLPLNTAKFSAKPVKSVSVKVYLESMRPLRSIYSPSHSVEIKRAGPYRASAGYEASDVQPDADFALYFAAEKAELGVNLIAHKTSSDDGYFLLLVSPGLEAKDKKILPKDVAFVLDSSGSMAGKKLEQAKKALQFCVENLNDGDRFEIIRFSTEVEPLFDQLVEANSRNRSRAAEFIKDLKPIGGTAIDDALKQALALSDVRAGLPVGQDARQRVPTGGGRPFVIIFLTDGRPTIGTTDEEEIVRNVKRQNEGHTRIFCFGIGTDVNIHLLDKVTEETRAVSQYVLPEEDLEVKVSNFFSKIKEPALTNPKLKFTGDVLVTKLYPAPLPDLFRGDQLVLVGRYSGRGDSAVVLEGSANGVTRKLTYAVHFAREADYREFIPRLWATRRVGYLLDEIRLRGENAELRDEVTELARRYGIVTPYTAYLIVEDETRRRVPVALQSLRQLGEDHVARRDAAENWGDFKREKDGAKALAGARYGLALKNATAPATAAADGSLEASRALGFSGGAGGGGGLPALSAGPAVDSKARLLQFSQQGQFVAGKNFYQNGTQWVDEAAQKFQNAKRQRIQFNSKEYFAFAAKERRALPWLALGQNVQFVLDDTLYEVHE